MNSCKEFFLDDVVSVVAIPLPNIPASDAGSPANILSPTISAESFHPSLQGAVTIGLQPAVTGGTLIPVVRETGKAKDDESDGVQGRQHTVSVSCEADDRDAETWDALRALERTPYHLLLVFRGGTRGFVKATEDTYLCTVGRDGAKTSVEFRIRCLSGIQLLA